MARPRDKAPARRYHISGQSVVTIVGRDFYLGPHDSPAAIARYSVLISVYHAGGITLMRHGLTIRWPRFLAGVQSARQRIDLSNRSGMSESILAAYDGPEIASIGCGAGTANNVLYTERRAASVLTSMSFAAAR